MARAAGVGVAAGAAASPGSSWLWGSKWISRPTVGVDDAEALHAIISEAAVSAESRMAAAIRGLRVTRLSVGRGR